MKKYVLVGCGARGIIAYALPLVENYKDCAKLCGVYDTNNKRAKLASKFVKEDIPAFDDFDEMLRVVKPDTVIVTPRDCDHDEYITRALKFGCDVISEKPVTTTFEKANAIKKVQEETGKDVRVTFNLRFHPFFKRVKEIISSGDIGDILSVHYEWMLDTNHGADYFRRWHRERKNSGSLLVHKSTHHFDIANWLLEQDPVSVNAFGTRRFYGPTREKRAERCLTCPYKNECEFYYDIHAFSYEGITYTDMYLNCEDADGYVRDKCVFSEEIDIEDSVCVNVQYSGGTVMSYSLTAHSPYEGFNIVLNGTNGRIEIEKRYANIVGYSENADSIMKIYNRKGEEIRYTFPKPKAGGHGGADDALLDNLFRGTKDDPLHQMADLRAGMMSIGIGAAANISMAEHRQVSLGEFYDELKQFDSEK